MNAHGIVYPHGFLYLLRACPLPWFHLLQHVNAKRDSIYSKTRQWKYYWLQNATRYVISKWWLIPCYQESIIDCKTRFDSFGRILGAGVPFVYASNVKANLGSLRNLPLKVETLHKSDIACVTCPGTYPSSRIPSSHRILSWPRPLLFEAHLIVLPFTLPADTSPAQCHQSSFTDDGYHYVFDSGEWQ
jgi:hypothetical protein